jgi:putative ABC transport system permease protein
MLGIIIGVAAVIVMVAIGSGARARIRAQMLTPKGQTATGSDSDDIIFVPYTTAATRLNGRIRIPQIVASAASEQDLPAAQDEIRGLLRESHRLTDDDEDDFTVRNQTDLAQAAESSTRVMTLLLAAIASISLLVGGIGIMNIMLVSVTERTREIGIRLAIGARGSDVLTRFLVESIVLAILGGAIGLATGVIGAKVLGHFTGWETVISPWSCSSPSASPAPSACSSATTRPEEPPR